MLKIVDTASPNWSPRTPGSKVSMVVLHIMQGTMTGTDAWFKNPASRVSAHYGVAKSGEVHQYVTEGRAAWHTGAVRGATIPLPVGQPNDYTIGIEHEGSVGDQWPEAQKTASAELIADICARHSIPIDRAHIVRHGDINAMHRYCPGPQSIVDDLIERAAKETHA